MFSHKLFICFVLPMGAMLAFPGCKPEKEKPARKSPQHAVSEKPRGEIIADDEGPQFEIVSGEWSSNGQEHWVRDFGKACEARWTIEVPASGNYEVFARWSEHPNRATNTPYKIRHEGGVDTVRVDQEKNGGQWNSLGVYGFSDESPAVISIASDADDYVIADAVKLVPR